MPDTNLIEEVIKLRSSTWTGTNDPLIFYTELKAKYDILMFEQTPPIKFKDIIITSLTNAMEPEMKYTCRELMMDDCMEGIKNISKLYNMKGKQIFFKNTNVEKEINCIYPRSRDVSKTNENTNDNKETHCNTKTHQRKDKGRQLTPYKGRNKCVGDFFFVSVDTYGGVKIHLQIRTKNAMPVLKVVIHTGNILYINAINQS